MSEKIIKGFGSALKSKWISKRREQLTSLLLLLVLVGLILYSLGSSQIADPSSAGNIKYNDSPSDQNLPTNPDFPIGDLNISDIPDITDLPTGGVPPPGNGNNTIPSNPISSNPISSIPSGTPPSLPSEIPSISSISVPSISTFQPPSISQLPSSIPNPSPGPISQQKPEAPQISINFPKLPSRYRLFPSINMSIIDISINFGSFQISFNINYNLLFYIFILLSPIILLVLIPKILTISAKELEEEKAKTTALEEKRKDEIRLKKEIERRKRLRSFSDHLQLIIEMLNEQRDKISPAELIILGYHQVDQAFSHFSQLRRQEGTTPLEHSHSIFQTGEINNVALQDIVDLFYKVRFGDKPISDFDASSFLKLLQNLVVEDAINKGVDI